MGFETKPWATLSIVARLKCVGGELVFTADGAWTRTHSVRTELGGDLGVYSTTTSGLLIDKGISVVLLSSTGRHIATTGWKGNGVLIVGSGGVRYRYERP